MAPANLALLMMLLVERGVLYLPRGVLLIQRAGRVSELEYLQRKIDRLELSERDSTGGQV